ncbi:Pectin degradation repressor protein KdgR [Pirellulimonas nuda]|uniref:Pectin degradation repressor protein KdgR n=1 Tax=Pirellulimonas nuda TaxID=2528009 RepID=A0A518DAL1_9BACT|nr:IclR family transcriptional regulator [Pirellulimonas nuda]QDU88527.1 Pectin degradation repressor protein KdgR [Pirellulimonas nuda]
MSDAAAKRGRVRTRTSVPAVRALERGLMVLEALGGGGDVMLSDVARSTGLTCSTTFRLLETLCQRGYAQQDGDTGRYRLGASAIQIGAAYAAGTPLPEAANGAMEKLVALTNETANLAVLDGPHAVYIHQVESLRSVRMFTELGARTPVYCTGVGKVLLAWRPVEEVSRLLADVEFEKFTPHTIPNLKSFLAELQRVRGQGYAVDDQERELGVRCATAPVRDLRGAVVAAISVSAPVSRFPKKLIAQRAREVACAADAISLRLGYASTSK